MIQNFWMNAEHLPSLWVGTNLSGSNFRCAAASVVRAATETAKAYRIIPYRLREI